MKKFIFLAALITASVALSGCCGVGTGCNTGYNYTTCSGCCGSNNYSGVWY